MTYVQMLVVEDDKELDLAVCSFLEKSGYETTGCLETNDASIYFEHSWIWYTLLLDISVF